jgi:hypothetical protein
MLKPVHSAKSGAHALDAEPCLPGTRIKVLEDIVRWIHTGPPGQNIFWLNGLAGTGKSTIARTVCDALHPAQAVMLSFFFSRRALERRTAVRTIHTLAFQLALDNDDLREHICRALLGDPALPESTYKTQIDRLMAEPLRWRHDQRPYIIVLDALDECDKEKGQEGGQLLPLLAAAFRHVPSVKIFVTSRNEPSIKRIFHTIQVTSQPGLAETLWLHKIEDHIVRADISVYLTHSFRNIISDHPHLIFGDDWPGSAIMNDLLTRAGVLFIFAATVVRYISDEEDHVDGPIKRLEAIVRQSPTETSHQYNQLDQLYRDVLDRATTLKNTDVSRFRVDMHRVLGALVLLQDPLTASALATLLNLDVERVNAIIQRLSAVLTVEQQQPVTLFHPSFSDFIMDASRCEPTSSTGSFDFHVSAPRQHFALARCCLQIMNSSDLCYDICGIKDPGVANADVQDLSARIQQRLSEVLRYVCMYWMLHLAQGVHEGEDELSDIGAHLRTFCDCYILHWLEIMSLLGDLSSARSGLREVTSWCNVSVLFPILQSVDGSSSTETSTNGALRKRVDECSPGD